MDVTPDPQFIASIQAANVAVGGPQTIIADGQPIVVPTLADVLAYLADDSLPAPQFDAIVSTYTIHHLTEPE